MKSTKLPVYFGPLLIIMILAGATYWHRAGRPDHANFHSWQKISLMTFNVENLFDTTHDVGKADYTFLPLKQKFSPEHTKLCRSIRVPKWREECLHLDWSPSRLARKMAALAKIILSVNAGRGPEILVLQEVENIAILENFRTQYLAKAHYAPGILIEGMDKRGIDVAVLSRLPLATAPRVHPEITRPILQLALELPDGKILHVFGIHLLAPFHSARARWAALCLLKRLQQQLGAKALVVAAGDFNITSAEFASQGQLQRSLTNYWQLAHLQRPLNAPGTHYHRASSSWSFLDMILYSPSLAKDASGPWYVDIDSIQVIKQDGGQFTPKGASDHWPLYLEMVRRGPVPSRVAGK